MSKAVTSFKFDIDAITSYFVPAMEVEDKKGLFRKEHEEWFNLITLLIAAMGMHADEAKFDFNIVFDDLEGKVPYTGRRKKIEEIGGTLIFRLLNESIVDYMYNLKIDPQRRKIIMHSVKKFRDDAVKTLKKRK